ncbi:RNA-binding protein [Colletotrichum tofieldiae]|nr:RNA-binding protein [Colletotrichum tofieldiae]
MGGQREQAGPYPSIQSALQASAAPFGPGQPGPNGTATAGPNNGYGGFYPSGYVSPNSNGPPTSGPTVFLSWP